MVLRVDWKRYTKSMKNSSGAGGGGCGAARVIVLNLALLTYERRGGALVVETVGGEELACVDAAGMGERAAIARALQQAAEATLWRDGERYEVGLLNPHTGQAGVGGAVYSAGGIVGPLGECAVRGAHGLEVAGEVWPPSEPLDINDVLALVQSA